MIAQRDEEETVVAQRPCPGCGHQGHVLARKGRGALCDIVRCPSCELHFSDVPPLPAVPPTGIEYLDRFYAIVGPPVMDQWHGIYHHGIEVWTMRYRFVQEYAWAIPSAAAIEKLAGLGPLVEVGAGGGYWAMLLRDRGVDVLALDEQPYSNHWVKRGWSHVDVGGPQALVDVDPARTLFLCWPPMSDMALVALARYRGRRVAYIGEHDGGCCASDAFFDALERIYTQVDELAIPAWPGMHDDLSVWEKK